MEVKKMINYKTDYYQKISYCILSIRSEKLSEDIIDEES
jgi:hypothetical protein